MGTRWRIEFDARSPRNPDGETWKVGIAPGKVENLLKSGDQRKLFRLQLIETVLADSCALFEGWSRPDMDGCYVYAGRPGRDYPRQGIDNPAPVGMVFLVFVLPDGTIDDWSWRPIDPEDPTIPKGITGKKIWPLT
jgi:hypothetical protein